MEAAMIKPVEVCGAICPGLYECSACGHRIDWENGNLDNLRYCWYCGRKFVEPKADNT